MTSPAGRADVLLGKQRLLPERHPSVRVQLGGGESLPAVAYGAAKPGGNVRRQVGVEGKGLRRILHGGVFHAEVAGGAAIDTLQSGQQVLANGQRRVQDATLGGGVGFSNRFQPVELLLVGSPCRTPSLPDQI